MTLFKLFLLKTFLCQFECGHITAIIPSTMIFFICSIYSIDIVWKITTLWNEIETDQNYFSCPHCFFCANSTTVPHFWLSKE